MKNNISTFFAKLRIGLGITIVPTIVLATVLSSCETPESEGKKTAKVLTSCEEKRLEAWLNGQRNILKSFKYGKIKSQNEYSRNVFDENFEFVEISVKCEETRKISDQKLKEMFPRDEDRSTLRNVIESSMKKMRDDDNINEMLIEERGNRKLIKQFTDKAEIDIGHFYSPDNHYTWDSTIL